MEWSSLVETKGTRLALIGSGVLLVGVGSVLSLAQQQADEVMLVEEVTAPIEASESAKPIVVDVSGAVVEPGVYELIEGMRVEDALVRAGGFLPEADTAYVTKHINRAQLLTDGSKIYIPIQGEMDSQSQEKVNTLIGSGEVIGITTSNSSSINVNSASQSDLESLWGIGAARAQEIISNRPYTSLDELKAKASIPQNVLDRNAELITF
jgi:competence protein ComEA